MKKCKFKTQQSLYIGDLFLCLVGLLIITIINISLSDFGIDWLYGFLAAVALMGLPAVISACACIIGRSYYVIEENTLKKFKGKKPILFISNYEIIEIEVIKTSFVKKLLIPFWFLCGTHFCDMVSIKYQNNNEEYDFKESRMGIGTKIVNNENGLITKYNVDLLPYRSAVKLAELLKCPIRVVQKFDFSS